MMNRHISLALAMLLGLSARVPQAVVNAARMPVLEPNMPRKRAEPGLVHGNRRTSVAAAKRAAKKRRNVRARSSKRSRA